MTRREREGKSERSARAGEPDAGASGTGSSGASVPMLVALAAALGLLLGAVLVAVVVLRRPSSRAAAPVVAPGRADDGLTEQERLLARAHAGDAKAMLALGRGLFQGTWGARDEEAAARWLGEAMNSRDAAAAAEATQVLEDLRRFVRARRFEREADAAHEHDR